MTITNKLSHSSVFQKAPIERFKIGRSMQTIERYWRLRREQEQIAAERNAKARVVVRR